MFRRAALAALILIGVIANCANGEGGQLRCFGLIKVAERSVVYCSSAFIHHTAEHHENFISGQQSRSNGPLSSRSFPIFLRSAVRKRIIGVGSREYDAAHYSRQRSGKALSFPPFNRCSDLITFPLVNSENIVAVREREVSRGFLTSIDVLNRDRDAFPYFQRRGLTRLGWLNADVKRPNPSAGFQLGRGQLFGRYIGQRLHDAGLPVIDRVLPVGDSQKSNTKKQFSGSFGGIPKFIPTTISIGTIATLGVLVSAALFCLGRSGGIWRRLICIVTGAIILCGTPAAAILITFRLFHGDWGRLLG